MSDGAENIVPFTPDQRLTIELAGGMAFAVWCKAIGISRRQANRWRAEGKLPVIHRYGQTFVTADTIRDFFRDDGTRPGRAVRRPLPGPAVLAGSAGSGCGLASSGASTAASS